MKQAKWEVKRVKDRVTVSSNQRAGEKKRGPKRRLKRKDPKDQEQI